MRLLLLLLPILFASCITKDVLYGNSTVTTVVDSISNYDGRIIIDIDAPVTIDSGDAMVAITLDENLQRYFSVDTTDSTITVYKNTEYVLTTTELSVHITVPNLENISCRKGTTTSLVPLLDTVSLSLSGSSEYSGSIHTRIADISVTDSASLALSGPVTDTRLRITSSQKQHLQSLELYKTDIEIATDQTTELTVLNFIEGILAGPGDLQLLQRPPFIYVTETGDGRVKLPSEKDISSDSLNQSGADTIFAL